MFMFDVMRRIAGAAYARATLRTRSIRTARHRLDMLAARGCRFLMAIPYLKSGGAERVAANLTHALAHLYGPESIAVLVTDWRGLIVRLIFPERTPNSYPLKVEFTNIVHLGHAPYDERVWDLKTALLSMQPQMVLNVNSHLIWEVFERFGPELRKHMRLGTVAFGNIEDRGGRPIGYSATHLERMLPCLDFVISDNQTHVDELTRTLVKAPATEKVPTQREWSTAKILARKIDPVRRENADLADYLTRLKPSKAEWAAAEQLAKQIEHRLDLDDAAKLKCVYQHIPIMRERKHVYRCERPQILWASRVTRAKFPEILPRIARLLPDCDIHAYGTREFGYRFPAVKKRLFPTYDLGGYIPKAPNLFWHGGYKSFAELPLVSVDAMLYTSLYGELPNVLLEAGAHQIPIVAPLIGGIGELITRQTGFPVENGSDPREYAERVRELLSSREEATQRAAALYRLIKTRHSFEAFCSKVLTLVEGEPTRDHDLALPAAAVS